MLGDPNCTFVTLNLGILYMSGLEEEVEKPLKVLFPLQVTTTTAGSWSPSAAAVCLRRTSWTTAACWSRSTLNPLTADACVTQLRSTLTSLCRYLKFTLDQYVEMDYILVYFHHGLRSSNKPSLKWLREAYSEFDRKYVTSLRSSHLCFTHHGANLALS